MVTASRSMKLLFRIVFLLMFLACVFQWCVDGSVVGYRLPAVAQELSLYDRAYTAFEECRYKDCISITRELLAGVTDPIELEDAENLLLLAMSWEDGAGAALGEAMRLREEAVQCRPGNMEELALLDGMIARFQYDVEAYNRAVAEIEATRMEGVLAPEAEFALARKKYMYGGRQAGFDAYDLLRVEHPSAGAGIKAAMELALLYRLQGDSQIAEQVLTEAVSNVVDADLDVDGALALSRIYLHWKDYDGGVRRLRNFVSEHVRDVMTEEGARLAFQIGDMLKYKGDASGALEAYRETIARAPESSLAYTAVFEANAILAKEGLDSVIKEMEGLKSSYPGGELADFAQYKIGCVTLDKGELDTAEQIFLGIITSNPEGVRALSSVHRIADISMRTSPDTAIAKMQDMIAAYPGTRIQIIAEYRIAAAYVAKGEAELAEQAYLSILERYPDSSEAMFSKDLLVALYISVSEEATKDNDCEAALEVLKKAHAMTKGAMQAEIFSMIASNLIALGRYEELHTSIKPYLDGSISTMLGEEFEYLDGIAYYRAGDYTSALPALERAASLAKSPEQKAAIESLIADVQSRIDQ